jgi:hypothetical protein
MASYMIEYRPTSHPPPFVREVATDYSFTCLSANQYCMLS